MKAWRLNGREIEIGVGLLATIMIAAGLLLYAWYEPVRIDTVQAAQVQAEVDSAATLYAENCSVCHGLAGEGIGATPPLNTPAQQEADPNALEKIIARGLYNTAMPAWSKEDGGPLSDYQIGELVTLIQVGEWELVEERVVNLGLAPLIPFTTEPDAELLAELAGLPEGELLQTGVVFYAEACVACHGADGLGSALAPALNDATVRSQTTDELQRSILLGIPGTLMAGWQNQISDEELAAVVNLIQNWDQVPVGAIPAPDRPVPVTEESLALGADLYASSCARCHGPDGQGTQRAPALNVQSFLADTNDVAMQQIISLGVPDTAMPAWGDRMTEAEIQAVVGYIRAWEPNAPAVATPLRGPWWKYSSSAASLPGGGVNPQAASVPEGQETAMPEEQDQHQGTGVPEGQGIGVAEEQGQGAGGSGGQGQGAGGAGGHAQAAQGQTETAGVDTSLDWRVIGLLVAVLTVGIFFGLVGMSALRTAAPEVEA